MDGKLGCHDAPCRDHPAKRRKLSAISVGTERPVHLQCSLGCHQLDRRACQGSHGMGGEAAAEFSSDTGVTGDLDSPSSPITTPSVSDQANNGWDGMIKSGLEGGNSRPELCFGMVSS